MISDISDLILNIAESLGYFGVFLAMFIETGIFPPIPSDIVLGTAGLLVYKGEFNYFIVTFVAVLGNFAGSSFLYLVGRKGGRPFLDKYGKYLEYSPEKLERTERWFTKHGDVIIFVSQFIPLGRSIITLTAGILEKDFKRFTVFAVAGSIIWSGGTIYIASQLGEEWEKLVVWLDTYQNIAISAAVLILLIYFIYRGRKAYRKRRARKAQAFQ
jgi:membrane protein DedA with SNARE-associated domain